MQERVEAGHERVLAQRIQLLTLLHRTIQVLHQHTNTARIILPRLRRHRDAHQQSRDRLRLVLKLILRLLARIPEQSLDQTRVIQLHDALVQLHLIHPGRVHEQLLPIDGLLNHHLTAHHVHATLRFKLILVMERDRIRIERVLREPIAQALGIVLNIQAPSLTIQLAQRHTEETRPEITALHGLSIDALDLGRRAPIRTAGHDAGHAVIRATDPVLSDRTGLVQLLIKAHGRLRHLNRSNAIRENLPRLEPEIDGVRKLPLRTEQRTIIQRHRVVLVVPHRGHR